jgi:sodium transport system permease protein
VPSARLQAALATYNGQVGALRLMARGVDAQVARPLDVATQDMASAEDKRGMMLPMLLIGTSLLTFLSAAAKSMKEAQSHMTWLVLLPMLPGYALMAYPVKSELWQYAVPFLSQNQMLLKVIRHEDISPTIWAIYLGASLALAAVLWFAAVRRYHNERLAISG